MKKIADIIKIFEVDKKTITKWCFEFKDYLSSTAVAKGQTRLFNESDLRVFALIYSSWEDDPDYENIRASLNSGDHNSEEYIEFSYLHSTLFQDATECEIEGEDAWTKGILLGGMVSKAHQLEIARSYKNAADILVEYVKNSHEPYDLAYPIFFLFRHVLESYLKVIGQYNLKKDGRVHFLNILINKIETKYNEKIPLWMKERLLDFHNIDPSSTSFRYIDEIHLKDEIWIDFAHLNFVMDKLCNIFEQIISKIGLVNKF